MSKWRGDWLARLGVPDSCCLVKAGRDDELVIGAERSTCDTHGVSERRSCSFASLGIPHACRPIKTRGHQSAAIATEADTLDNAVPVAAVEDWFCDRLAGGYVPDLEFPQRGGRKTL